MYDMYFPIFVIYNCNCIIVERKMIIIGIATKKSSPV